jgi:D-alanine-D-alanine ligase
VTPRTRVAVVFGGISSEAEVSERSGDRVLRLLPRERYEALPVRIARDGRWAVANRCVSPEEPEGFPGALEALETSSSIGQTVAHALSRFAELAVDAAFVALHGVGGEDGRIQGLFETVGLPYTGSGVAASAIAMDKWRTREVYADADIPIARGVLLEASAPVAAALDAVDSDVGFPCVVKPRCGGSSVGVSIVSERGAFGEAWRTAAASDDDLLVEEFVSGRELTCGVLGNSRGSALRALPSTEIRPVGSEFFDYRAKYTPGAAEEITPAPVDAETERRLRDVAVRAHRALGCDGFSRTDAILRDGRFLVLETNTIPGLTDNSLLPRQAQAAGIGFGALLDEIVQLALERVRR